MLEFTDETVEAEIQKPGLLLLDFWAPWCGPCKMLAPVLEALSVETTDVRIAKIDIAANTECPAVRGVRAIPTLILFLDGAEVDRRTGFQSKTDLIAWFEAFKKKESNEEEVSIAHMFGSRAESMAELAQRPTENPGLSDAEIEKRIKNFESPSLSEEMVYKMMSVMLQCDMAIRLSSKASAERDHPAYKAIVALGKQVLGLVFLEMAQGVSHYFSLVGDLGEKIEIPEEHRGKTDKVREIYLAWARKHGYLLTPQTYLRVQCRPDTYDDVGKRLLHTGVEILRKDEGRYFYTVREVPSIVSAYASSCLNDYDYHIRAANGMVKI